MKRAIEKVPLSYGALSTAASMVLMLITPMQIHAQHVWIGTESDADLTSTRNWTPGLPSGGAVTSHLLLSDNGATLNPVLEGSDLTLLTLTFEGTSAYSITTPDHKKFIFERAGAGIFNNTGQAQTISIGMIEASKEPITLESAVAGGSLNINLSLNDGIKLREAMTVTGSGDVTITGRITGSYATSSLVKEGSGTLTLNSQNSYEGTTTVNGGVLRLNHSGALVSGNLRIDGGVVGLGANNFNRSLGIGNNQFHFGPNGGGFAAFGANRNVNIGGNQAVMTWGATHFIPNGAPLILGANNATHTVTFQNPIALGTGNRTIDVRDGAAVVDATLSGALTGSGSLTKTGTGTLLLTATNTYTGATRVNAGTLRMGGTNRLLTSTEFEVFTAATLDLNNFNTGIGSLAGGGSVHLGSATLTVGSNGLSTLFSGHITGTGGVTKIGTGTLTLDGPPKAFTGTTSIQAGTLVVNTLLAGNLNLGGNGTLGGAGGFNALTWNSGGTIAFNLGQNGLGVANTLTRGTAGGTYLFDFLGSGQPGVAYRLLSFGSTNFDSADFSYANLRSDLTGGSFHFSGSELYFTPIPEPTTSAVIIAGLALLGASLFRHRGKRRAP
jgi:fibronectin-binding autotransporter adhesin